MRNVRVAGVQMDPKILEKEKNLSKCLEFLETAAKKSAEIIVFPECALTGYCFSSLEESFSVAEPVFGPSSRAIAALCRELNVYTIIGLLEKDGEKYYNTVVLIGPKGLIGKYRKLHLPFLGIDRFVDPGDQPLKVFETGVGRIGMNICFDIRMPESARVLTLLGAESIMLPTNWPKGADLVPKYVINARAYENRVNVIAVNRVGKERGFEFIGQSKIVDYSGKTLVEANSLEEEIIFATIDLDGARKKHIVLVPGEFELPLFKRRRPEFYGLLVKAINTY
jgi:predicted amidohydrolase